MIDGVSHTIRRDGTDVTFRRGEEPLVTLSLDPVLADLPAWIQSEGGANVPDSLLIAEAAGESLRVRLLLDWVDWNEESEGPRIDRLNGTLLIGPR